MLKKLITAILCAIIVLAPMPAAAKESDGSEPYRPQAGWCIEQNIQVAPAAGQPKNWTVAATYCQPFRWAHKLRDRHVDILTHGATYTNKYWDWPEGSQFYSYLDRALGDGRAVVLYDRIGNGESSRPAMSANPQADMSALSATRQADMSA